MNNSSSATTKRHGFQFSLLSLMVVVFCCAVVFAWGSWARRARTVVEPNRLFRIGSLGEYAKIGVYEQHKERHGFWIVHLRECKLVAIKTMCTHLGCTPNWLPDTENFKCPCYGSEFDVAGLNLAGPARRPLVRYKIGLEGKTVMVDKSVTFRAERGEWTDRGAFLDLSTNRN